MGIFDKWKAKADKKNNQQQKDVELSKNQTYLEIGEIVSDHNIEIIKVISECVSNPQDYFIKNIEQYGERGIENGDIEIIRWIGLVDCIVKHNYACEIDWKEEASELINSIKDLNGTKKQSLTLKEEWFDEECEVTDCCSIIDNMWEKQEFCIGSFDINSDSYIVFPIKINDFIILEKYAKQIGQRIALAKNM